MRAFSSLIPVLALVVWICAFGGFLLTGCERDAVYQTHWLIAAESRLPGGRRLLVLVTRFPDHPTKSLAWAVDHEGKELQKGRIGSVPHFVEPSDLGLEMVVLAEGVIAVVRAETRCVITVFSFGDRERGDVKATGSAWALAPARLSELRGGTWVWAASTEGQGRASDPAGLSLSRVRRSGSIVVRAPRIMRLTSGVHCKKQGLATMFGRRALSDCRPFGDWFMEDRLPEAALAEPRSPLATDTGPCGARATSKAKLRSLARAAPFSHPSAKPW